MRTGIFVSATAVWILSAVLAYGQKDKVLETAEWQGTLTSGVEYEGTPFPGITVKFRESTSGTFVLDEFDPILLTWRGRWTSGTATYFYESVVVGAGCTTTQTMSGSGPIVKDELYDFELEVSEYRPQWKLHETAHIAVETKGRTVCGPIVIEDTPRSYSSWVIQNPGWRSNNLWRDLPANGTTLSFSETADYDCSSCNVGIIAPGWKINATLSPKTAGELELEINSTQYRDWLPTATRDGGNGEPIEFTATLKRKDGATPNQKVERFVWELIETSKEPGVAINWPAQDAKADHDMILDPQIVTTQSMVRGPEDDTAQKVTTHTDALSDKLQIFPRDWGAWSTLRVTAYTAAGTKVVGKFKGASEEDVRLPDRDKGQFVAKAWKRNEGVSGKDDSDDENIPEGDGNKGDGLTLYEEYRGFYEEGDHQYGLPKTKDYFAKNEAGSAGSGGLSLFQRISGLMVHGNLKDNELADDRVLNRNYSASPRRGPQHGILLKVDKSFDGYAQAVSKAGHPSTPKDINYVGLPEKIPSRPTASPAVSYSSSTVAHELLHTVNVYHHGEADRDVQWTRDAEGHLFEQNVLTVEDDNGNLSEALDDEKNGIRVFAESGEEVTPRARVGRRNLGIENGQHAGWEDCVMRYDIANVYVSRAGANDRYAGYVEKPGARLCDSTQGIDVNADGRNPQSRYGPASGGRGSCRMQILVNDSVNPQLRK